jgi:hypothetical protein
MRAIVGLLRQRIEERLPTGAPVTIGYDGPAEDLLVAGLVALALEEAERKPTIRWTTAPSGDWPAAAGAVVEWFDERETTVPILGGPGPFDVEILDGAGRLASPARAPIRALVGAGAEVSAGGSYLALEEALARAAVDDRLLGVDWIPRYGPVGRLFVELWEHAHHATGPDGQGVSADTVRASLFGRVGSRAVNLATRETPPRVGFLATCVLWLEGARSG